MSITVRPDYSSAGARQTNSLSVDIPYNTVADLLVALVSTVDSESGTTTALSISGWTSITSIGGALVLAQSFYRAGGISGTVTVTANEVVDAFNIIILVLQGAALTSPVTGINSTSSTSSTLSLSGITTDPDSLAFAVFSGTLGFGNQTGITGPNLVVGGDALAGSYSDALGVTYFASSGATGSRSAQFSPLISGAYADIMFGIKPYPGPTIPTVIYPNGGESLTVGAVVNITWSPSTSPTAAQNTLKYNIEWSSNNGGSWSNVVTLTSAGVTSYAWTVPSTTGSGNLIRIRANDPAASLFSADYDQSNSAFTIAAEVAPGQPTITAPTGGSVQNKAVNVTVAWNHQGGAGNPQVAFTLQWANNVGFTSPTTVGSTTTGTQSTSIDFSAQTAGTTIYVKVKTQGVSLYSAYSNITSFVVASLPATPNITAPTAGSPPTTPMPTVTFTEADSFVSRKMRVTVGGIESYNSGDVSSSSLSFVSPYNFANGIAAVLYLSVKNSYGLASAEDSETMTPVYAGPATPTLTVQTVNTSGYILAQISNSDTPVYNEIWRYEYTAGRSTAIRVGASLPKNVSFSDYNVKGGVIYQYFARAYNGSGLFTDSADSAVIYLTLVDSFLHVVSRTSTSGNAISSTAFILSDGSEFGFDEVAASHKLLGRTKPVGVAGQAVWQTARVVGIAPGDNTLNSLMSIWRTGAVVCLRSGAGHKIFGRMTEPGSTISVENINLDAFSFTVTEEDYTEGL